MARAQSVGVAFVTATGNSGSDLKTLHGARVEFTKATHISGVSWRFGAHYLVRGGDSYGSTCSGLVQPGTCPPEPLAEHRRLAFGSFGIGATASVTTPLSLGLYADLLLGHANTDDRGRTSGLHRASSLPMLGGTVGLELRARLGSSRASGYLGASATGVNPFVGECADCFQAFGGSFGFRSLYAGVAIGKR
jgi:hypothetical protein